MKTESILAVLIVATCLGSTSYADVFGTDPNYKFHIPFVTIGNPGNAADTTGKPNPAGSVSYEYRIAKYEVSWEMFHKAKAQSIADGEPLNLYLPDPNIDPPTLGLKKPVSCAWPTAAKFVNWLNISTGHNPAYKFSELGHFQLWAPTDAGYDPDNLFRNSLAKYVLPDTDEWYKAAYYDPNADVYYDYPTGSNTAPLAVSRGKADGTAVYRQDGMAHYKSAGGLSPYGTMAQGGNAEEWEETEFDLINDCDDCMLGMRGGSWTTAADELLASTRSGDYMHWDTFSFPGIRVVSLELVPEPSGFAIALGVLCSSMVRRRPLRQHQPGT